MSRFLSTLNELREQTFQRLCTSVEEEKARDDWFAEVKAREEKASQQLRQLQKDLRAERVDRECDVSVRDEQVRKLRSELNEIKTSTVNQIAAIEAEAYAQENADRAAFTDRCVRPCAPSPLPVHAAQLRLPACPQTRVSPDPPRQQDARVARHSPSPSPPFSTPSRGRESALRAELTRLKADLAAKRKENKDSEDALRKRKVPRY
jgi:hypothetical protein